MKKSILIILTAFCFLTSCLKEEFSEDKVKLTVRAISELLDMKSSIPAKEIGIMDMNVYAYSGGKLHAESYAKGSYVKLMLDRARHYNIYVLANVGKVDAPLEERELASIRCTFVYKKEGYLPMASRQALSFQPSKDSQDLTISLSRLVSKYTLNLKKNVDNCWFIVDEVNIRQEAESVAVFVKESSALSVSDGDSATPTDLMALNEEQDVVFYVMENCQGILLPTNTEPYKKEPASIGDKAGLCTYLEIKGSWFTDGAEADLYLRLYLGEDNIKDFNVRANTNVVISLELTDNGTLRSVWKSELSNMNDSRILSFKYPSNVVYQEDGWTKLPLNLNPSSLSYDLELISEDVEQALEYKVEDGQLYARALYDGNQSVTVQIKVSTWDGVLSSKTNVLVLFHKTPFEAYEAVIPDCVGQYGYVRLDASSSQYPIVISTGGPSWTVGDPDIQEVQSFQDPVSEDWFYYSPKDQTLYIYRTKESASTSFSVDCWKSGKTFILKAATKPQLVLSDAFVSELGCYHQDDQGLYYDSQLEAYLSDSQGNRLDMSSFATPAPLLESRSLTNTLANAYANFDAVFGKPSMTSDAPASKVRFFPLATTDEQRYSYYEDSGNLWAVKVAGINDLNVDSYLLNVDLPLASLRGTATLSCLKAFPKQRHLGEMYNYQIAPGSLRSKSLKIDFTDGGQYYFPPVEFINWELRHSTADLSSSPEDAFNSGVESNYSRGASMSGDVMSFSDMSSDVYPSCGHMALKASVTNPYSGKTYNGYYTLDLLLFMSIGCQFDYLQPTSSSVGRIAVSFVPFCEFSTKADSALWADMLPHFLMAKSTQDTGSYRIQVPASASANSIIFSGADFIPGATYPLAMSKLGPHKDYFEFNLYAFFNSGTELLCNREGFQNLYPSIDMQNYKDGRKGYYHLYRQYDLANIPMNTYGNGLENYLIEAAYKTISEL